METRFFYLPSCDTCKKIQKTLKLPKSTVIRDIKSEGINKEELEQMALLSGSYESLFSKKAIKYRTLELNKKVLSEKDYKELILNEYTFLKRPVLLFKDKIFVGNLAKTIEEAYKALHQ